MILPKEVKYIQSLSDKKNRATESVFTVENPKPIAELLQSNWLIKKIYTTEFWLHANHELLSQYQKRVAACSVVIVKDKELARISLSATPNQVIALVKKKIPTPPPFSDTGITLVLDKIQNPGNFGTLIRIADWFGISHIVCSEDTADLYNHKVIQSSMGSFMRVDISYQSVVAFLADTDRPIYGTCIKGKSIYNFAPAKNCIVVIGNESVGINTTILPFLTESLCIPRIGNAESLNVSVAAGIILSHMFR